MESLSVGGLLWLLKEVQCVSVYPDLLAVVRKKDCKQEHMQIVHAAFNSGFYS